MRECVVAKRKNDAGLQGETSSPASCETGWSLLKDRLSYWPDLPDSKTDNAGILCQLRAAIIGNRHIARLHGAGAGLHPALAHGAIESRAAFQLAAHIVDGVFDAVIEDRLTGLRCKVEIGIADADRLPFGSVCGVDRQSKCSSSGKSSGDGLDRVHWYSPCKWPHAKMFGAVFIQVRLWAFPDFEGCLLDELENGGAKLMALRRNPEIPVILRL